MNAAPAFVDCDRIGGVGVEHEGDRLLWTFHQRPFCYGYCGAREQTVVDLHLFTLQFIREDSFEKTPVGQILD
jgi:hypothetical protein